MQHACRNQTTSACNGGDGKKFNTDFNTMQETDFVVTNDVVKVKRVDLAEG